MKALPLVFKMGSAVSPRLVVNEIRKGVNLGGGATFLIQNKNIHNFCLNDANYFIFSQKQDDDTEKLFRDNHDFVTSFRPQNIQKKA